MNNKKKISNKYFYALFNFAFQKNEINNCKTELDYIKNIFQQNEKIFDILKSEFLTLEDKFKIIEEVFNNFSQYIKNFLKILIKKKIIDFFPYSFNFFSYLCDRNNLLINGTIFSTYKLEEKKMLLIEKIIKNKIKRFKYIKLKNKIDKSLLGGIKIIIDDKIYDYSIINNINLLKKSIISEL